MIQWEYMILIERSTTNIAEVLDVLGSSGWELVSSVYNSNFAVTRHYLKREL